MQCGAIGDKCNVKPCIYSFFVARKLARGIDGLPVLVASTDGGLD